MWDRPAMPEEETLIDKAVKKRQREFRAGRHCARQALRRLAQPEQAILRDDNRAPVWPSGIIGSITHCRDMCLAACANEGELVGLGVDAEPLLPLSQGVEKYIHSEYEQQFMKENPELPERLIFSAKESLYKAFYPLMRRYFGFLSVELEIEPASGSIQYRPATATEVVFPDRVKFDGRFLITENHLITSGYLTKRSG
jgi:4'-phosphopantetheinyl transferase EntD